MLKKNSEKHRTTLYFFDIDSKFCQSFSTLSDTSNKQHGNVQLTCNDSGNHSNTLFSVNEHFVTRANMLLFITPY